MTAASWSPRRRTKAHQAKHGLVSPPKTITLQGHEHVHVGPKRLEVGRAPEAQNLDGHVRAGHLDPKVTLPKEASATSQAGDADQR